jgi:hypothetical protein
MNGHQCGSGVNKDKPLAAWPLITQFDAIWCVANCQDTSTDTAHFWPPNKDNYPNIVNTTQVLNWCVPVPSASDHAAIGAFDLFSKHFDRYLSPIQLSFACSLA